MLRYGSNTYLVRVVEADVDGCGTSADEYVEFPCELNNGLTELFQELLTKAKQTLEDTDTEGFVENALEHFQSKTGIAGTIVNSPCDDYIEF